MDTRPGYPDKKVQYSLHIFTFRGGPYKVKEAKHSSVSYPSSERGGKRKKKAREGEKERKGVGVAHITSFVRTNSCKHCLGILNFVKEREEGETLRILSFLSLFLSKISRSVLLQRKCFINEASLYISSKKK